ncbi:MAG: transcriptional regulator [Chitinophagaceae bacterium]
MSVTLQENGLDLQIIQLKKAAIILRAINHKLRQQMLSLMHQFERLTVTEIYIKLRLEQSVTSQQLAILRAAGFVVTKREGKKIYYSVNYTRLEEVQMKAEELAKYKP